MIKQPDINKFQDWVYESQIAQSEWRSECWRDVMMYDGGRGQWTEDDWDIARAAGVDPITVNKIFPACNLLIGTSAINPLSITAKARTSKDGETSQMMSEGIQYVLDQNNADAKLSAAFRDQVVPGFGCLSVYTSADPRKESIAIGYRHWTEIGWDPFASPWWDISNCRYVFHQRWVDLAALQAVFPKYSQDLQSAYDEYSSNSNRNTFFSDEATKIEEDRSMGGSVKWADGDRKRVRPVELYYTTWERAVFAKFPEGHVLELKDQPLQEQYMIATQAQEIVRATVQKVNLAIFVGNLLLDNRQSPYPHDQFPLIPFVSYLDRYNYPYGIPRQLRDQNIEINKRRSMALALLKARRVVAEKGSVAGGGKGLQTAYEEANKIDGFVVVEEGKIDRIRIIDQDDKMVGQMRLLQESNTEIREISGANAELLGYAGDSQSGVAKREQRIQGATVTAEIFGNYRRSIKMLGEQVGSLIQNTWTGQKVLRITDRLSGAEKFVALNEKVVGADGRIQIKNDITQGKYDYIISEIQKADTVREQNMNLIIEWVKKSPPK